MELKAAIGTYYRLSYFKLFYVHIPSWYLPRYVYVQWNIEYIYTYHYWSKMHFFTNKWRFSVKMT